MVYTKKTVILSCIPIVTWNNLPDNVIKSLSNLTFEKRLDNHWKITPVMGLQKVYNLRADRRGYQCNLQSEENLCTSMSCNL
jgi:hypothetical protein